MHCIMYVTIFRYNEYPFEETVVFINFNYIEFIIYMQVMMRSQVLMPLLYKMNEL
jgi:hypothetical protein